MAFSYPTPQPLATALNELSYDVDAQPITLVLHNKTGTMLGALSATIAGSSGEVFLPNTKPTFTPLLQADGQGFTTYAPQPSGVLRFIDQQGPVVLKIENLRWSASAYQSCNVLWVDVVATIPANQLTTVLHLVDETVTIKDLIGPIPEQPPKQDGGISGKDGGVSEMDGGGGGEGLAPIIHFSFMGNAISFDFSTL